MLRTLPSIDLLKHELRARVCTHCHVRPPHSESLGPEVVRPCELSCPVFVHLPAMRKVAVLRDPIDRAPGGAWLTGDSRSRDGSVNARDTWGRDPLTGELIRVIFDGGGTFATVRSSGWGGDTLVLEGEARSRGGTIRVRETISRVSPERFDVVWEAYRAGRWSTYALETARRRT